MSGADTGADVVRRLVLLERIPMLAELSPAVLYGLAERASGALVRQGDPLGGGPEIMLVPLGVQVTHAPPALDAHALGLLEGRAGRPASGATESLADTAVVRVRLGDLHAVLEDEFSLFLAVASGVAGGLVEAAGGVVTGTVVAVGEVVGVPATNADRAHALMDAYPAASWSDQPYMAFQISAYASLVDYLKWTVDKSHRPEPGAY